MFVLPIIIAKNCQWDKFRNWLDFIAKATLDFFVMLITFFLLCLTPSSPLKPHESQNMKLSPNVIHDFIMNWFFGAFKVLLFFFSFDFFALGVLRCNLNYIKILNALGKVAKIWWECEDQQIEASSQSLADQLQLLQPVTTWFSEGQ